MGNIIIYGFSLDLLLTDVSMSVRANPCDIPHTSSHASSPSSLPPKRRTPTTYVIGHPLPIIHISTATHGTLKQPTNGAQDIAPSFVPFK